MSGMSISRCDICLDEDCGKKSDGGVDGVGGGGHICNCGTCKSFSNCIKFLAPSIRITRKCTQECDHCCFSCSPSASDMMSIDTSKNIKKFMDNNNITTATIMCGEFFCNPGWREIFDILIPGLDYVRLVTAGDWVVDKSVVEFLKKFTNLKVSFSKDRWHTNRNVESAISACDGAGIKYDIATDDKTTQDSVVPVGRGELSGGFGTYSMFSCYCHNPMRKYSFLIDELGKIYKCGFGVWDYARVSDYVEGGFNNRFKEFNKKFYSYL